MHKLAVIIMLAGLLAGCAENNPSAAPMPVEPVPLTGTAVVPVPNHQDAAVSHVSADRGDTAEAMPLASTAEVAVFNAKEHVIYSGKRTEKKVALTFDDGPDAKYTYQILDILKKNDVVATFFVTGEHAAAHKEAMKRIVDGGHEIGNHSWDHVDLTKLDQQQLEDEIDKTDEVIKSYTGHAPAFVRPPYGALSQQVADYAEKSHKIVNWSVDTRDWEGVSSEKIVETVKKEIKPGAIILQHCAGGKHGNLSNTVKALPQLIQTLKEKGYRLVTVSELLQ
ncbi:polysaccharide deacetylase family protein [Paenibacillus hamazuiensis]|uniref:polysaccharide deacetylase family protein n=1 Tax=Paenibacillus hamazuiensis TaxID=2936508 RepID=UPI00200FF75B|nr:polysaccharide deacetylase family protein [Paenibacillus hamazuiensis]